MFSSLVSTCSNHVPTVHEWLKHVAWLKPKASQNVSKQLNTKELPTSQRSAKWNHPTVETREMQLARCVETLYP